MQPELIHHPVYYESCSSKIPAVLKQRKPKEQEEYRWKEDEYSPESAEDSVGYETRQLLIGDY